MRRKGKMGEWVSEGGGDGEDGRGTDLSSLGFDVCDGVGEGRLVLDPEAGVNESDVAAHQARELHDRKHTACQLNIMLTEHLVKRHIDVPGCFRRVRIRPARDDQQSELSTTVLLHLHPPLATVDWHSPSPHPSSGSFPGTHQAGPTPPGQSQL